MGFDGNVARQRGAGVPDVGRSRVLRWFAFSVPMLLAAALVLVAEPVQASPASSTSGVVWAWGSNNSGQLGDGTTTTRLSPVSTGVWANSVDAGGSHTMATNGGCLYGWGSNSAGQLGDNTTTNRLTPTRIEMAYCEWSAVAAGTAHTVGIQGSTYPSLLAWGYNGDGQLGTGGDDPLSPHEVVYGQGLQAKAADAGGSHTVAISKSGLLYGWGRNTHGQVGDGSTTTRQFPRQVGTNTDWATVAAGDHHTVALKQDGSLWAWGDNSSGQLGDGTLTDRLSPTYIGSGWTAVSAGMLHTVALKADGSLWAWGDNSEGQLGDGTTTARTRPTRIGTATDWTAVSVGNWHTVALKADGSLWAWGRNSSGQLGDGSTTRRLTPIRIGTGSWTAISAGAAHTVAIQAGSPTPPSTSPSPIGGELYVSAGTGGIWIEGWHTDVHGGDYGTPVKVVVVGMPGFQETNVGGNAAGDDWWKEQQPFDMWRALPPGTYEVCASAYYHDAWHEFGCVRGVVVRAS